MKHSPKPIKNRLSSIIWLIIITLIIIIGRLIYLQVGFGDFFVKRGEKNFLRHEKILSPRGNITDCNGTLLATNRPVISINWQGTGNKILSQDQQATISYLEKILDISCDKATITYHERQGKIVPIACDISIEKLAQLLEKFPNNPNIKITTTFKRFYPQGTIACHILGYLAIMHNDSCGKMGLEALLEEELKGTPGKLERTVNSFGKRLFEKELSAPLSGETIITTLNLEMQKIAEEAFPCEYDGAFLGLNPRTGDLTIVVSRPGFDPNMFLSPISTEEWETLQAKKPFITRPFSACYPPASLFKLVTAAAALEEGFILPDSTWTCYGHIDYCGRPYHCHKQLGHGFLTLREVIAHSCNIPFFEIGKKIKIDTLAHYAHKFGLGEKTGVLFPEKAGLVPTSHWKRTAKGEPWWPGETLSAAIGQSFLLITPLQAARMMGGVCEGYLVKPRITQHEPIEKTPIDLSESTFMLLREGSRMSVKQGTSMRLRKLSRLTIHAKTGTAQTSDLSKRELGKEFLEHGWFVAHVQYQEQEPLVIMIFLENAGSSRVAVQVATNFLLKYCEYCEKSNERTV